MVTHPIPDQVTWTSSFLTVRQFAMIVSSDRLHHMHNTHEASPHLLRICVECVECVDNVETWLAKKNLGNFEADGSAAVRTSQADGLLVPLLAPANPEIRRFRKDFLSHQDLTWVAEVTQEKNLQPDLVTLWLSLCAFRGGAAFALQGTKLNDFLCGPGYCAETLLQSKMI